MSEDLVEMLDAAIAEAINAERQNVNDCTDRAFVAGYQSALRYVRCAIPGLAGVLGLVRARQLCDLIDEMDRNIRTAADNVSRDHAPK